MKIKLILVGKTDESWLEQGISKYISRLKHYCTFEMISIPALKDTKNLSKELQKSKEAALIIKAVQSSDFVILLDEKGKELSSEGLAEYLDKLQIQHAGTVCFIIGGPYGFDDSVCDLAREKLSLSKMTFSHQMVRLFFLEQLYRAFTISRNEPYHHS